MDWQNGNSSVVRERMFAGLQAADRAARDDALQALGELRGLCIWLAQQLDGGGVQDLQRLAPDMCQTFTPAQWRQFFEPRVQQLAERLQPTGASPSAGTLDGALLRAECDRLRATVQRQERQVRELQSALDEMARRHDQVETRLRQAEAAYSRRAAREAPAPVTGEGQANTGASGGMHAVCSQALQAWQPPQCPARFRSFVSEDSLRWRRQSMALFLMAAYGLNARFELDHLIARAEGLKSRPGSLRSTLDQLSERGLAASRVLQLKQDGFQTSLVLVRLSQTGKELCASLGWAPVESDWERLIAHHEGERFTQHTLGVMAFGVHARARGWRVEIVPLVDSPSRPDVRITRGAEQHCVEVELGEREKENKWRNLAALQGHVALCAGSAGQRAQLVSDCRSMQLPGLATDLETLVPQRLPLAQPDDLWRERW